MSIDVALVFVFSDAPSICQHARFRHAGRSPACRSRLACQQSASRCMDPLDLALRKLLESSSGAFLAAKYVGGTFGLSVAVSEACAEHLSTAASLVCVLYDHLLTFGDAVSVIWIKRCPIVTKAVYVVFRYVMESLLIYAAYSESVPKSERVQLSTPCFVDFAVLRPLINQHVRALSIANYHISHNHCLGVSDPLLVYDELRTLQI